MQDKETIQFLKSLIREALLKSVVKEDFSQMPSPEAQPQPAGASIDSKPLQVATFLSTDQRVLEGIKQRLGGKFKTQSRQVNGQQALDIFMIPVGDLRPFVASVSPVNCKLQVRTDENVRNIRLHGNDVFQNQLANQQSPNQAPSKQGTIFQ